jgi:hypothetical protein
MTGVAYVTAKAVTPEVVVFDMKGRLTSSCSSHRSYSLMRQAKAPDGPLQRGTDDQSGRMAGLT